MDVQRWRFPYRERGRFANYPGERSEKTFWRAMRTFMKLLFQKTPVITTPLEEWLINWDYASYQKISRSGGSSLSWIGHATFLLRMGRATVLTDPIFGAISYILSFPRFTQPGILLEQLPPIDVVLISHNHRDHMDEAAILFLHRFCNPLFLVPYGDKKWFEQRNIERVEECMWWDVISINPELSCTFVPAVHWSQRTLTDRNKSLWGGWIVEQVSQSNGQKSTVYFAGDTAYGSHFSAIGAQFPSIDYALMPVGPTEPADLMRCSHVSPEQAGQAFLDLNARNLIPMHWGAYQLGAEDPLEPINRITSWWNTQDSLTQDEQYKKLIALKMGELLTLESSQVPVAESIQSHQISL